MRYNFQIYIETDVPLPRKLEVYIPKLRRAVLGAIDVDAESPACELSTLDPPYATVVTAEVPALKKP